MTTTNNDDLVPVEGEVFCLQIGGVHPADTEFDPVSYNCNEINHRVMYWVKEDGDEA